MVEVEVSDCVEVEYGAEKGIDGRVRSLLRIKD